MRDLAAAGFLLLAACNGATPPAPKAPAAAIEYGAELAALEAELEAARAEATRYPQSWGVLERIAGLHLSRARLSGDYADYDAAEAALDRATALAGNGTAVCATRAQLEFALHRLDRAQAGLTDCEKRFGLSAETQLELRGLAASIEFYRGRYAEALAGLRAALAEQETIPGLARLSQYHASTGNNAEALALLDRAERMYFGDSAQLRAWLKLQRAVIYLESGRWEDALAHLLAAERELHGWWLIEEHIAEVKALLGETETARALYRDVIARTGAPELLDALAQLEFARGDDAAARELVARAEVSHRKRLARWPEAATGHALEHFLRFGNPDETLALALANARHRPYGGAQVQLARAYLQPGRLTEGRAVIERILATPWNTAELHGVAHEIFHRAGKPAEAQAEARRASALNPGWRRQYSVGP